MADGASEAARPCPFCRATRSRPAYPWRSRWEGRDFRYLRCARCALVFIDPVPDAAMLDRMYASGDYHEEHYDGEGHGDYDRTARRIASFVTPGARILDFGCGAGHLLSALGRHGLAPEGAEFSPVPAALAERRSGYPVFATSVPGWHSRGPWDAIHVGDVLEHLPDPIAGMRECIAQVRPGGLLSLEGPIEDNPSLVLIAARLFARAKRLLRPERVPEFPPYHLIFASAASQRRFLCSFPELSEVHWSIYETGWPYRNNGTMRNAIALAALGTSKLPGLGRVVGNRFAAVYRVG
jgi:SAM-dependent methyltransferase